MAISNSEVRFAHNEGYTSLSYNETGSLLVTTGTDGDLRVWQGMDDDDPKSHPVGEIGYSVLMKNERIFVSTNANSIQILTYSDFFPDGIVAQFSAPVTHMDLNKDGSLAVAGSCDFTIKAVKMASHEVTTISGHEAPILSIALDPRETYVASSSCDGTVKIWLLLEKICKQSWNVIPKSNDFSSSKTLCRISWKCNGQYLAVPAGKELKIFERDIWELAFTLTDEKVENIFSIAAFSPCGSFLAGSTVDGWIFIWNFAERKCIERRWLEKKYSICGLQWNPVKRGELALCDIQGRLCILENILPDNEKLYSESEMLAVYDDLANMDDDDDEDNENAFSISKIKAETVGLVDEDSNDETSNSRKMNSENVSDDDSESVALSKTVPSVLPHNFSDLLTKHLSESLQDPFQPGSTPVHLKHRFMTWNSVGIIFCYNTDEENSIDVEFHDTSIHHALHIPNSLNHTMAALSNDAVLLASESQDDIPSQLVCMHFASWDNCKEWTIPMPAMEEIQCIALGNEWTAVATSSRNIRLFTIGGVQQEILALPGQIVSMSGYLDFLIVVYHTGIGFPGDQPLGVWLMNVSLKKSLLPPGSNLPLSPKSFLMWLGFSDEGTPCAVDSQGIVRLLNRQYGSVWYPVANTKSYAKGKSDHYFMVGLSESQQQIRCIPCKGSRYPPTLPRPVVTVLPLQLPICELSTEKGQLEEKFWRYKLLNDTLKQAIEDDFEIDSSIKDEALKNQQETLMKLFALACRCERKYRAMEVCEMMPSSHAVQLAIKYASRLKHMQLAQRLGEIAYRKMEEETSKNTLEIEYEEEPRRYTSIKQSTYSNNIKTNSEHEFIDSVTTNDSSSEVTSQDYSVQEDTSRTESVLSPSKNGNQDQDDSLSITPSNKNPFKVNKHSKASTSALKGTELFDKLNKMPSKTVLEKQNNRSTDKSKEIVKQKRTKASGNKDSGKKTEEKTISSENFQLWFNKCEKQVRKLESSESTNETPMKEMDDVNDTVEKMDESNNAEAKKRQLEKDGKKKEAKRLCSDSKLCKTTSKKLSSFSFNSDK